jgi:hypothetical protein
MLRNPSKNSYQRVAQHDAESRKFFENIKFLFEKIDPSELAIIINKTHIVFKTTKRF